MAGRAGVIAFDEALRLVLQQAKPLPKERIDLHRAANRTLAAPVSARIDSPRTDVSSMDGYAVRDADIALSGAHLHIIGEAFPGEPFQGVVESGTCVRVVTGAPVPSGAERIVIREIVTTDGERAVVTGKVDEQRWIRRRASDFAAGDILLGPPRRLDARALIAAAAGDVARLETVPRPRVCIVGTGSELVAVGEAANSPFLIPDSISVGLAAQVVEWGGDVVEHRLLADDLDLMKLAASELPPADVVVITGGASVGERDFAKAMFQDAGLELIFSKVAMKPGKPVWLGRSRERLVMGLPGNPSSALVTARLLLAPLLAGLAGRDSRSVLAWQGIRSACPMPPGGERDTFWRASLAAGAALPLPNQDSGAQGALADADLLIRRPSGAPPVETGDTVDAIFF